jgi:hypothetical protein
MTEDINKVEEVSIEKAAIDGVVIGDKIKPNQKVTFGLP